MKVVLFCGGMGTRLREHSGTIPKPLANIGSRPILWHLMRYYAHFGHTDFVLCLGYGGELVRDYFLHYREEMTNDFTLHGGTGQVELHSNDIANWRITFIDTGMHSNIGQRLLHARKAVADQPIFLANYADGLTDMPLNEHIEDFAARDAVAGFLIVPNPQSFHEVRAGADGVVQSMGPARNGGSWINGGYFVLRQEIFDYMQDGDELVEQPFNRLIAQRKLVARPWQRFWRCMDTYKDKIAFDRMEAQGDCPWMVWRNRRGSGE